MSIGNMPMIEQTTAMRDGLASGKVRALIAKHLGVAIERVTDDAHFAYDLGADWLDRVELVIAIEGTVMVCKPASISAALLLNSPAIPNSRRATARSLQNCANRRQVAAW